MKTAIMEGTEYGNYEEMAVADWILSHPLIDINKLSEMANMPAAELKFFLQHKSSPIGAKKINELKGILIDYGYIDKV